MCVALVIGFNSCSLPCCTIHSGGDEAVKDQWRSASATQARIAALGLKDENALQGRMMSRLARFLEAHGRTAIGWDEILEGDVPQSVAVMSWRGIDGAINSEERRVGKGCVSTYRSRG